MFPVAVVHAKVAPAVLLVPAKFKLVTKQVSSAVAPGSADTARGPSLACGGVGPTPP